MKSKRVIYDISVETSIGVFQAKIAAFDVNHANKLAAICAEKWVRQQLIKQEKVNRKS